MIGSLAGQPPIETHPNSGLNTYLWVIMPDSIPYILEEAAIKDSLESKRVTHTNLSGGNDAHCGGELWVKDAQSFVISGGSGRYRPRSKTELDHITSSFRGCGFRVASLGWDEEISGPVRYLRNPNSLEWV